MTEKHHKHSDHRRENYKQDEQESKCSKKLLDDSNDSKNQKSSDNNSQAQQTVDALFGNLTITDTNSEQETKNVQRPVGKPYEIISSSIGDNKILLKLDKDGMPAQITDRNGEKFVKRADNQWYRESMLYPNGEKLDRVYVDPATKDISITYNIPKNENQESDGSTLVRRTIKSDGKEVTQYDINPGAEIDTKPDTKFDTKFDTKTYTESDTAKFTTITTREGNKKTIEVETDGKTLQTLTFEKDEKTGFDQLVKFVAPDNSVYEKTGKSWSKDGRPVDGTLKADNNGAVKLTYNKGYVEQNPDKANATAARFLPNGTRIESDTDCPPKMRTIFAKNGTKIEVSTNGVEVNSVVTEDGVPMNVPSGKRFIDSVKVTQSDGTYSKVSYNQSGDPVTLNDSPLQKINNVWVDGAGKPVLQLQTSDGPVDLNHAKQAERYRSGDNDLEQRPLIQELPDNYQQLLAARLYESSFYNYSSVLDLGNPAGPQRLSTLAFIYKKTHDSGEWDDKQQGGQYQRWGNVAWGMYADKCGIPYNDAIWYNGLAKAGNGKRESEWGSPTDWNPLDNWYDSGKTYGQNPADARLIKFGYEQLEKQMAEEMRIREEQLRANERDLYQPRRQTYSVHPTF